MDEQERNLAFIKQLPFFSIFSEAEKEYLSTLNNHIMSCKHDEVIIRQGEIDTALFILIKGKIRIFKNERPKLVLAYRKPGDIFGEISYLKKTVRTANAVAETDSIFLSIDGLMFEKLSAEIQNKFRARFLDILVERLDDLGKRYIRDTNPTVNKTLAKN